MSDHLLRNREIEAIDRMTAKDIAASLEREEHE